MTGEAYDVVVVGGGTAGCVLAARLSEERDRSVLLLEAGPVFAADPADPAALLMPDALRDERVFPQQQLWSYCGFHSTDDDAATAVVRGRVLGGSGAVNGLIYQRGLPEDYDAWGSEDWTAAALEPFFDGLERDPARRGSAGPVPLKWSGPDEWAPTHRAFHDALMGLGQPANDDALRAEHQGVGSYARNVAAGARVSAAVSHLLPALGRPNLTVRGEHLVHRVIVERGRATGVELWDGRRVVRIGAGEVILAAGAIESPHLLTLSGIAHPERLRTLGITPVAELPGVGQGLSDHPSVVTTARLRPGVTPWDLRCLVGLVTTTAAGGAAGLRSDLQLIVMSGPYAGNNAGHLPLASDPNTIDAVISPILYAPESRGYVDVVSAVPSAQPQLYFGYMDSAFDRERLREGTRLAAAVIAHPAFAELVADAAGVPSAATLADDAALDAWMRASLQSTYHSCGTCRMGVSGDPMAVVDDQARVHGVDHLRVADLSIVPRAPAAPTNATAFMIGERVAAFYGRR